MDTDEELSKEVKSTVIAPIALYCFFLALVPLSVEANLIFSCKTAFSGSDLGLWIPVGPAVILAAILIAVGIGFLNLNPLCWKILFFGLAICVSCIASILLVYLFALGMNINLFYSFFNINDISSSTWFSFLFFFLSEIIILY